MWDCGGGGVRDAPPGAAGCICAAEHTTDAESPDFKGTTNSSSIKAPFTQTILLCGYQVACGLAAARIFMKGTAGYRLRCLKSDGQTGAVLRKGGKGRQKERLQEPSRVTKKSRSLGTVGESRWERELCLVAASSSSPLLAVWEAWTIPVGLLLASLSAQESHVPQVSGKAPPTI